MKLSRRQFLSLLPASALTLAACGTETTAPAQTQSLVFSHAYPLEYAQSFRVDCYEGGYRMAYVDDKQFLIVPEGAAEVEGLPAEVVVLRQPLQNIYLVSSPAMDPFIRLDALGSIRLSGVKTEGWYLDEAKAAMQAGTIVYAGKYSAPDYELILASNCGLAIENTMIYHTPEVKEQLERFGIPVMVERSTYESTPLARMEWIKLYGVLLGKEEQAEQIFREQLDIVAPVLEQEPTGKTAAFFAINSANLATVRKGGDYVAQMIEMAGASYAFADLTDSGSALATISLPLEDFYAGAKDADVLIYNSTIEGVITTLDELVAKCPLLAEFKAVQNGCVYCTTQSFFQQSMELSDMILDFNCIFTQEHPDPASLRFLTCVTG